MKWIKTIFIPCFLSLLLFYAFQCEPYEPYEPSTSSPEEFKLEVLPEDPEIKVGDTIWLYGKISSKVMHLKTLDSIIFEIQPLPFLIYRLKTPMSSNDFNSTPAASEFDFIPVTGKVELEDYSQYSHPEDFTFWDNLQRLLIPDLTDSSSFYTIRIAMIPRTIGYFAFHYHYTFLVDDFHRDLFAEFNDASTTSLYAKGKRENFRYPVDNRLYFLKVIK